jgi:triosephosphate isomerase (TIM)
MILKPLIAGNWKMNGLLPSLTEARAIAAGLVAGSDKADVLLCPPFTLISAMVQALAGTTVAVGGQDCHPATAGAHTGDVSAAMLRDLGASYVIVGHSERRADHGETSALVAAKAKAAHTQGLTPIICIGETEAERDAGRVLEVVLGQLTKSIASVPAPEFVVAYEPVWAIGTGRTPTIADVAEVHNAIRATLVKLDASAGAKVRILYGGSVKPTNAAELLAVPNVNGALVGGASLKATDFLGIIAGLA